MNIAYTSPGWIGVAETGVILVILAVMAAVVTGVVFLVLWLNRRVGRGAAPAAGAAPGTLAACPRCGKALPVDAPQGLCPRCVLQVGLGTEDGAPPAFKDAAGKPSLPDPGDLARQFPNLEIIELVGQGGMGAVYKARQKDLDRLVALKILPGGSGSDPAFTGRFMREARALARLSHPNIVAVHDFGQVDRDSGPEDTAAPGSPGHRTVPLYYFIMEFVDGPNLRQLMRGQRLSPRDAMSLVPKICEALQFAHDEGIVHRDIKPENILLDRKGRVKIADFGIAKIVGKGRDATLTGARDVIGTPHYMAPEQVEHPTEVDHRADIYSLGVVFYEMLTGELPLGKFEAPSRRVEVDVRLDEVVLRSLAKSPERRYQHASQVKTDVETIAAAGTAATMDLRQESADAIGSQQESSPGSRQPVPATDTRLSRLAVVGACWVPFLVIAVFLSLFAWSVPVPEGGPAPGPAWWQIGLSITILPLGLTAPFGTTLCGVIALSRIRHSRGGLHGLGLALFDALLFPILLLDGLIVWVVYLLMGQSLVWVGFRPGTEVPLETALLPAALIVLVLNVWLVRGAWRSAKRMVGSGASPAERGSASVWTRVAVPVSVILLMAAVAVMVVSPLQARHRHLGLQSEMQTKSQAETLKASEERRETASAIHAAAPPPDAGHAPAARVSPANPPPVVIATVPAAGSTDVRPSVTELRVTFSKPMQEGSWSWVKADEETFPEMTGQPRFSAAGRTCILPVRLQPGKTYATWINVDAFQEFRDLSGQPAVPYLLIFKTEE